MVITKNITLCDSCVPDEREATQALIINGQEYHLCPGCYTAIEKALVFLRVKIGLELKEMVLEAAELAKVDNLGVGPG